MHNLITIFIYAFTAGVCFALGVFLMICVALWPSPLFILAIIALVLGIIFVVNAFDSLSKEFESRL